MRRSRRRVRRRARLRTLLGLVVAAQILTGGLAGAQVGDSETLDITVLSGRSITVGPMFGDGEQMRQTDIYAGISSAISEYVGESSTDVIEVSRVPTHVATQNSVAIDETKVAIKVLVYDLTCELCAPGEGEGPGAASVGLVTIPVSDRPEALNPVTNWVTVIEGINTGTAAAWANLDYTVVTTGAVAGVYSYVITYRIRAAA